jgi:glycosyltransferase involved in cell wall biosynthesis
MRLAFYRLADRLLVYSERGKELASVAGYPAERVVVIYNSLDLEEANAVVADIERGASRVSPPAAFFSDPDRPTLVCTARLTRVCRFDLLLRSAALMRDEGRPANILLVGDGPMRPELEKLADDLKLDVHFTGAVYDEKRLGNWLYHADLTVSPGKVGLTAIHSMMYGTPVITHGNLDAQMPEVETVVEGETGAFFDQNDERDLARAILGWLEAPLGRDSIREHCRAVIREKWNPHNQARLILHAIEQTLGEQTRGAVSS